MGSIVSVAQAKSQFAALVARAEAGEKIIVTRSGRAVACLGPLPGRQPIKYGELSGVFLAGAVVVLGLAVYTKLADVRMFGQINNLLLFAVALLLIAVYMLVWEITLRLIAHSDD